METSEGIEPSTFPFITRSALSLSYEAIGGGPRTRTSLRRRANAQTPLMVI